MTDNANRKCASGASGTADISDISGISGASDTGKSSRFSLRRPEVPESERKRYKDYCMKCGCELYRDETALHRKLILRSATEYMCIDCLAEHFRVSVPDLEERIEYFRATGCSLFV